MRCVLFLFCLGIIDVSHGQSAHYKDSLLQLITAAQAQQKIEPLVQLGIYIANSDLDSSIHCFKTGYSLAMRAGDTCNIVRTGRLLAEVFRRTAQVDSALKFFNLVRPIAEQKKLGYDLKYILNSMGAINLNAGNFDYALEDFFKTLEIRQSEGDKEEIGIVFNNIGLSYFRLQNFEYALKFYKQSLANKPDDGSYDLDLLYFNIGLCHSELNQYDSATYFIDKGFERCGDKCPDTEKSLGLYGRGLVAYSEGHLEEAITLLNAGINLTRGKSTLMYQHTSSLLLLGKAYLKTHETAMARDCFLHALRLAEELESKDLKLEVFECLSELFRTIKDYRNASEYQTRYISISDSIYKRRMLTNLLKVERDYLARVKDKEIHSQYELLEIKDKLLSKSKSVNQLAVVAATMLLILLATVYKMYRQKRVINRILDEKVKSRTEDLTELHNKTAVATQHSYLVLKKHLLEIEDASRNIKVLCEISEKEIDKEEFIEQIYLSNRAISISLRSLNSKV